MWGRRTVCTVDAHSIDNQFFFCVFVEDLEVGWSLAKHFEVGIVMDTLSAAQRSRRMSLIRGKNTSPEIALRKRIHAFGLRYVLHNSKLPGKPDLTFTKYRTVVFVHGCFWHQHTNCKVANMPKSNIEYWKKKFEANRRRDEHVQGQLIALGWNVIIVWECEVNTSAKAQNLAATLVERIISHEV